MMMTTNRVDVTLERLAALNRFVLELNRAGRLAGLHRHDPWHERVVGCPEGAVPADPNAGRSVPAHAPTARLNPEP